MNEQRDNGRLIILNDISKINSNPELHPPVFRQLVISHLEFLLDLYPASDRVHDTRKLSQQIVSLRIYAKIK